MCGITAIHGVDIIQKKSLLADALKTIEHRGDCNMECCFLENCILGANRLKIMDRENAGQPLSNEDGSVFIVLNGEIYNHEELKSKLSSHQFKTDSDTEVLVHAYEEWGPTLLEKLDGQFAFIIYDSKKDLLFAARDPIGIKPLYYSKFGSGVAFASEMKALLHLNPDEIMVVEPGTYIVNEEVHRYFALESAPVHTNIEETKSNIKRLFQKAVKKRVQTDLPIGVFLSGGLDSSLVLKYASEYHPNVTAFCVGAEDSEDLYYARKAAEYFGINLKTFDPNKINAGQELGKFIYFGETFEPNLVVALGLQYHGAKLIHDAGIKVALCGEGADEIFGGYSEFKSINDGDALHAELIRHFNLLHRTQLQRVDRMSMAHSVETRVPFLDCNLAEYAMKIHPSLKIRNGTAKWILRETFRDELPDFILNREKNPFSLGATSRKNEFEPSEYGKLAEQLPDTEFLELQNKYKEFGLETKEEAFYFQKYAKYFLKAKFSRDRIGLKAR